MKKKLLAMISAAAIAMTMTANMFSYATEPMYPSFNYNNTNDFLYALENDFDESIFDQLYGKGSQSLQSFITDAETYGVYVPYVNGEDLSEKGFNMYPVDMFDRTNLYFQGDRDETGIQYMNESLINDELKAFAEENGISALMHQLAPSLEYDASYEATYTIGGNDYNVLVAPFEDDPRIFIFLLHENALFRIALYEEIAAANSTLEHLTFQQVRLDPKTEAFDEESFFVMVGTSGGYTQLRYFGSNSAEKVIWEDAPEGLSYGDVFTAKGDISLVRVRSAPNDPANAMTYHFKLGEGTELTKVGNCTDLMEQKELTVTDTTYDGSSHWSIHLMDQDGNEYRYGLNTFGSYLWVDPLGDVGEVYTYAFYKGDLVVPLAKKDAVAIPGDVNKDGVFSISDVTLLGRWLLGRPGVQLPDWKAADLYEDGKLDVYDMCLMKKALLGDITIEPEIPDVLFGYEKEEEPEYPVWFTTQKLALKCKAYCPAGETLKVDAAMGDLYLSDHTLYLDEADYDYKISSSDYFTKKDLIVNGEQSEYIKTFPKEEWENLDISGKEGEFDLYHHETSEIDFSNYETGSSGCIEFVFMMRYPGGSYLGMVQRMYFFVGENGTAISNLSVEEARTNYHALQNQNKPGNMPDIIDDHGGITDKMKAALYSTLEREYPDTDFRDFTFVHEPEHPLKSHLRGNVFSIYYKDVLLHGYANLNTDCNVYATIDHVQLLADPAQIMQIDTDAPCLPPKEAVPFGSYESIQKVIYIDVHSNTLKLAYRAVMFRDCEYICDAVTGELIECISYNVV